MSPSPAFPANVSLTACRALETIPIILQAFSEAVGERLGATVSVMLALPIPSLEGKVEVRR